MRGSAVSRPGTSFQSETREAPSARATSVAERSVPPRPSVAISPSGVAPMKPGSTGTRPRASSGSSTRVHCAIGAGDSRARRARRRCRCGSRRAPRRSGPWCRRRRARRPRAARSAARRARRDSRWCAASARAAAAVPAPAPRARRTPPRCARGPRCGPVRRESARARPPRDGCGDAR